MEELIGAIFHFISYWKEIMNNIFEDVMEDVMEDMMEILDGWWRMDDRANSGKIMENTIADKKA